MRSPLFSGHRTTPQATTSPVDRDRAPLRGSGPARASQREANPVRVPGCLTLSGVSLATPRRTQARQVTWRLRFMVVGDNASQAGRPYPGETTPSSAKGRTARKLGRLLDVIHRRRRERGGGFAGSGRGRKQMGGDGDLCGPCSCESVLVQTKEKYGTLRFRTYVSLLSNPLQYGVKSRASCMVRKCSTANYILFLAPPPAVFGDSFSLCSSRLSWNFGSFCPSLPNTRITGIR